MLGVYEMVGAMHHAFLNQHNKPKEATRQARHVQGQLMQVLTRRFKSSQRLPTEWVSRVVRAMIRHATSWDVLRCVRCHTLARRAIAMVSHCTP